MSTATAPAQSNGQAAAPTTALATVDERSVLDSAGIRRMLSGALEAIKQSMPAGHDRNTASKYAIALATMLQKDEKLRKCTAFSLRTGVMKASLNGLELGPPLNHCYLIPRWSKALGASEATFQFGYPGIAKLINQHPAVARLGWDVVRKGDHFEEIGGTDAKIIHKVRRERDGAIELYYCECKLRSGESLHKVMSIAEIDDHRKRFSEFGTNKDGSRAGTWLTHFDSMALKTVLLQVGKIAPKSIELPNFEKIENEPLPVALTAAGSNPTFPTPGASAASSGAQDGTQDAEFTETESGQSTEDAGGKPGEGELVVEDFVASEEAFDQLLADKGMTRPAIIARINKDCTAKHKATVKYLDIPAPQRKRAVTYLLDQPSAE